MRREEPGRSDERRTCDAAAPPPSPPRPASVLAPASAAPATPRSRRASCAASAAPALAPGARRPRRARRATRCPSTSRSQVRDAAGLQAAPRGGLHDPTHRGTTGFSRAAQFARRFGATGSGARRGRAGWLRGAGLTPRCLGEPAHRSTRPARRGVAARGCAPRSSPFARRRPRRRSRTGAHRRSPRRSPPTCRGIVGLSSLPACALRARPHDGPRRVGPVGVAHARWHAAAKGVHRAPGSRRAPSARSRRRARGVLRYSPLYELGDRGGGVHVAVAEFEPDSPPTSARSRAATHIGATVNYAQSTAARARGVRGRARPRSTSRTWSASPRTRRRRLPGAQHRPRRPRHVRPDRRDDMKIISTSWGRASRVRSPAVIAAEDGDLPGGERSRVMLFSPPQATRARRTASAPSWTGFDSTLAVDDPGSQPYVISVGGTTATRARRGRLERPERRRGRRRDLDGGVHARYQDNANVAGLINPFTQVDAITCPTARRTCARCPTSRRSPTQTRATPSTGRRLGRDRRDERRLRRCGRPSPRSCVASPVLPRRSARRAAVSPAGPLRRSRPTTPTARAPVRRHEGQQRGLGVGLPRVAVPRDGPATTRRAGSGPRAHLLLGPATRRPLPPRARVAALLRRTRSVTRSPRRTRIVAEPRRERPRDHRHDRRHGVPPRRRRGPRRRSTA